MARVTAKLLTVPDGNAISVRFGPFLPGEVWRILSIGVPTSTVIVGSLDVGVTNSFAGDLRSFIGQSLPLSLFGSHQVVEFPIWHKFQSLDPYAIITFTFPGLLISSDLGVWLGVAPAWDAPATSKRASKIPLVSSSDDQTRAKAREPSVQTFDVRGGG